MVVSVATSGRWSYPALKPSPEKYRGKGQEMACRCYVALSDHGDRFGQATSRICTDKMRAAWAQPPWTANSGRLPRVLPGAFSRVRSAGGRYEILCEGLTGPG
jgi:hypothetical protein